MTMLVMHIGVHLFGGDRAIIRRADGSLVVPNCIGWIESGRHQRVIRVLNMHGAVTGLTHNSDLVRAVPEQILVFLPFVKGRDQRFRPFRLHMAGQAVGLGVYGARG